MDRRIIMITNISFVNKNPLVTKVTHIYESTERKQRFIKTARKTQKGLSSHINGTGYEIIIKESTLDVRV